MMTRVLVIEDEKDIRENIIEILTLNGFEAQGASNGERGLTLVQAVQPDVVLCDIMMDGIDGFGVLETVRNDELMSGIPFIFLTALSSHDDLRLGMNSGADDYLMKPFNAGELIDAINSRVARLSKPQGQFTRIQTQLIRNVCDQLNQPDDVLEEVMESLVERVHRIIDDDTAAYYAESDTPLDLERLTGQLTLLAKLNSTTIGHENLINNGTVVTILDLWRQALKDAGNIVGDIDQVNILTDENNIDAAVLGDQDALTAAFTEIIVNAFQHSAFNGVITIAQWATRNHVWFSVTDSGKGMTQAHVRMLLADDNFEKGLGLTLAKRIAEAHGGDLRIDSAPNQGTIVALRLPLAEVDIPVRG